MNAYDKIYLEDAAHNFGVMVDCAVNTIDCPPEQFWARFLASSIARRFSRGFVDIIAGHSGIELALMVFGETGRRIETCDAAISISSREYWAGSVLSRYQWSTGLTFKELTALGLGLTQAIAMFNPLHEADWTSFEMVATDIIRRGNRDNSWLRTARKINGFTQEQLAAKSGVSIRLIRAYEQEKINISNAEYSTIMRLRNALNCA
ncbi:MAG: helix-turn-helix domain-containing protein [Bacteroidaceae bacterium]|nr:helix-turn-helix domain-containing protein [Bacteroidaceae bacterium]